VIILRLSMRVDTCDLLLGHGVSSLINENTFSKLVANMFSSQALSIKNRTSDVLQM
jgi:hypothetical protein